MNPELILVIEDDAAILFGLRDNLQRAGYRVRSAGDGHLGLELVRTLRPDLVLLDLMLPGLSGHEVCRRIRDDGLEMPVVMLTALGEEAQVVRGLNLGADDYVTKPFGIGELMARVAALLRRRRRSTPDVIVIGTLEVDRGARRVSRGGVVLELTPKEYGLLEFFTRKAGRALTREQILNAVWGESAAVTDRSVDRAVTTLRAKIEENPNRPRLIQTVPQIGYRFEA
jgi:DNA-binding response OmpR family regulator